MIRKETAMTKIKEWLNRTLWAMLVFYVAVCAGVGNIYLGMKFSQWLAP